MREYKLAELCPSKLPLAVEIRGTPCYQAIHRHDAIELVYIRHGAGWCAVDGVICPMLTGDLYVIPVGTTHEYYGDPGLSYVNCLFDRSIFHDDEMALFQQFVSSEKVLASKYTFGPYLQEQLTCKLDELNRELRSDTPWHLERSRALFIDFLVFVLRNAAQAPGIVASCSHEHLGRVLSYIAEHLDEKLSLERLAALSGYNPDYLGRLFRREVGAGVSEYIRSRRLERACLELEKSDRSIDEIARMTGFFDASYFIRTFKKYCSLTPAQFRRKARKK